MRDHRLQNLIVVSPHMVSYRVSVWHFQLVRKKPWKKLRGADAQAVGWTCVGTTTASTALFVEGTVGMQ